MARTTKPGQVKNSLKDLRKLPDSKAIGEGIKHTSEIDLSGQFPGSGNACRYEKSYPQIAEEVCAKFGATNKELAAIFGVSIFTITSWLSQYPSFKYHVQKGKDEFDSNMVEKSLRQRALGYNYKTKEYKSGPKPGDETYTEKEVHVPPDVKAQTIWLTNRNPERWSMVRRIQKESTSKIDININTPIDPNNLSTEELEQLETLLEKGQPVKQLPAAHNQEEVIEAELVE